jgi:hypothetical protein
MGGIEKTIEFKKEEHLPKVKQFSLVFKVPFPLHIHIGVQGFWQHA